MDAGFCVSLTCLAGCISGSLATSTGPRQIGHQWSTEKQQMVCRGEEVKFDFVLEDGRHRFVDPAGLADYCVVIVGAERIECDADLHGHFPFSYRFDRFRPGDRVPVSATAYTLRASRDYMKISGRWMRNESPYDLPDRKGVAAKVVLTVYESPVELTIPAKRLPLDPETAVLRIHKEEGAVTTVFQDLPHRSGFHFEGPRDQGDYFVRYVPRAGELNSCGVTRVSFTIYDVAGQAYRMESEVDTP